MICSFRFCWWKPHKRKKEAKKRKKRQTERERERERERESMELSENRKTQTSEQRIRGGSSFSPDLTIPITLGIANSNFSSSGSKFHRKMHDWKFHGVSPYPADRVANDGTSGPLHRPVQKFKISLTGAKKKKFAAIADFQLVFPRVPLLPGLFTWGRIHGIDGQVCLCTLAPVYFFLLICNLQNFHATKGRQSKFFSNKA